MSIFTTNIMFPGNNKTKEFILFYYLDISLDDLKIKMLIFNLSNNLQQINVKKIYIYSVIENKDLFLPLKNFPIKFSYECNNIFNKLNKTLDNKNNVIIIDYNITIKDINISMLNVDNNIYLLDNTRFLLINNNLNTIKFAKECLSKKICDMDSFLYLFNYKHNLIKNVEKSYLFKSISILQDFIFKNINRELSYSNHHEYANPCDLPIEYDHPNFLYYPLLDLDDEIDRFDLTSDNSKIVALNTNGFYYKFIENRFQVNCKLFKRFHNKKSGLFVRKFYDANIIPYHFHHLFLYDIPSPIYANYWNKLLKNKWQYHLWTLENLRTDVFKPNANGCNRWEILFDTETNYKNKTLIASFAILEKYGGIIIDGDCIPNRPIPDYILKCNFFVSFLDEEKSNLTLSYRCFGAFYKCPIIDLIYNLAISKKLNLLDSVIFAHPDATIYPSYYFNSTFDNLPILLRKLNICIVLWKIKINDPIDKETYLTNKDVEKSRKNIEMQFQMELLKNPINQN